MKNLFVFLFAIFVACPVLAQSYTQGKNFIQVPVIITTAAGTTTLTNASGDIQDFIGSTTQTVKLPNALSMQVGRLFTIINDSTGIVTVTYNDTTTAIAIPASKRATFRLETNGTSNGTWSATTSDAAFGLYLPLLGGTMAGNIAMGSNNITGAGTVSTTSLTVGSITGAGALTVTAGGSNLNTTVNGSGTSGNTLLATNGGNVGIGTTSPAANLTLYQGTGSANTLGFNFTGNSIGGSNSGTGFLISLGYNSSGNKQVWFGDPDYAGLNTGTFIRMSYIGGGATIDAVLGDNSARTKLMLGDYGDPNSNVMVQSSLGVGGINPKNSLDVNGALAIGTSYAGGAMAPTNGAIIQGNVGIGTTSPAATLDINGTIGLAGSKGTSGQVLTSNGSSNPTWQSPSPSFSSLTQYGALYASTTSAIASTTAGTAGYPLVANSSAAPTFQQLALGTGVTGTLPVANGGTGSGTALTQYGVKYASSTTAELSTGAGTTGQALVATTSSAPSWGAIGSAGVNTATFLAPTVQTFTSGSGTYTLPTSPRSPLYIKVTTVGGGGGGNGGGSGAGAAGNGGTTSFGTSLISSTGGLGGNANNPGAGSITTSSTVLKLLAISGGTPDLGFLAASPAYGGRGGDSSLGGAGGNAIGNGGAGNSAAANSGSGGAGGATNSGVAVGGMGGCAGGTAIAIINSPSSTYSYAVGAAGSAGSGGSSGFNGGAGGSGIVIVEEHYQ